MFKLDDNFLQELGLGLLPVEEKKAMLGHIYETLEMRVGMKLAEQMTNEQLDEFEGFIDKGDEAGALKWLETNFPNYKQVVADELEKLKTEIKTAAPQIVAASEQARVQQPAAAPVPQLQYQPQQPTAPAPQQFAPAPQDAYPAPAPVYPAQQQPYSPAQQQYGQPAYPAQPQQYVQQPAYPQPAAPAPQPMQYQPQQPTAPAPQQFAPAPQDAYPAPAPQQSQYPQPPQFPSTQPLGQTGDQADNSTPQAA